MSLIKINYKYYNKLLTYYKINDFIKINNLSGENIILNLDYQNNVRINNMYIPQYFKNNIIFQSYNSFQQTNKNLSKYIYSYILNYIETNNYKNIIGIGGESFYYLITSKLIGNANLNFFTNSINIYKDSIFNMQFIFNIKNINVNLINYDKYVFDYDKYSFCILNLSKIPLNIIQQLNNISTILIISCDHKDFWNKIKSLKFHKIISRKKFVCYKTNMFITVNILIKNYIPLGFNCSIAYFLKNNNLRFTSYPFDWCQIDIKKIIECFEHNFTDFTNFNIVKFSVNHLNFIKQLCNTGTYILKNKYCKKIAHEINNLEDISILIEKYKKRIYKILSIKNPCFLIAINNKKHVKYIDDLNNVLKTKYKTYELKVIYLLCEDKEEYLEWKFTSIFNIFFGY